MELTKKLDVTPKELFDALEASIRGDIEQATGKRPGRAKLNGYKYQKKAHEAQGKAKGTEIKVKIRHFDYPHVYEARFSYSTGTNTMRYEAVPTDDGGCELTYTEEFEGQGGNTRGFMGKLGLMVYERKLKSRANATIDGIVKYVKGQRHVKDNPLLAEDAAETARGNATEDAADSKSAE